MNGKIPSVGTMAENINAACVQLGQEIARRTCRDLVWIQHSGDGGESLPELIKRHAVSVLVDWMVGDFRLKD
jgi:hypothetical protein